MLKHSRFSIFFLFYLLFPFAIPVSPKARAPGSNPSSKILVKGTADGVAIRSTGGLELAPSFKLLYATPSTFIWAVAADDAGNVYAATGSPARVYRITPDGKSTIIFEPQELQVQALKVGPGGVIYAATAPDGKVYKIEHKPGEKAELPSPTAKPQLDAAKDAAKPALDSSWSSSVYFAPGTKYIWDLILDKAGISMSPPEITARSTKSRPRAITRFSSRAMKRTFACSRSTRKEISSPAPMEADWSTAFLQREKASFSTALRRKRSPRSRSIARATSMLRVSVRSARGTSSSTSTTSDAAHAADNADSAQQPAPGPVPLNHSSAVPIVPVPVAGTAASGGSDVYRIAADGSPSRLWTSHDDIVYALAFDSHDKLLAGTGNRGHVFAIDGSDEFTDLTEGPASQVTGFAKAPGGGLYASSSNLGKIFRARSRSREPKGRTRAMFSTPRFSPAGDASNFAAPATVDLLTRSGNVDNPDRNWSPVEASGSGQGCRHGSSRRPLRAMESRAACGQARSLRSIPSR